MANRKEEEILVCLCLRVKYYFWNNIRTFFLAKILNNIEVKRRRLSSSGSAADSQVMCDSSLTFWSQFLHRHNIGSTVSRVLVMLEQKRKYQSVLES